MYLYIGTSNDSKSHRHRGRDIFFLPLLFRPYVSSSQANEIVRLLPPLKYIFGNVQRACSEYIFWWSLVCY